MPQQMPEMILLTNSSYPDSNIERVREIGVKAWTLNVDTQAAVMARLNENLPQHEQQAAAIVKSRIAEITSNELMDFYRPHFLILKWDIKKLPAMVIGDGDYVLYGVTDYAEAFEIISEYTG